MFALQFNFSVFTQKDITVEFMCCFYPMMTKKYLYLNQSKEKPKYAINAVFWRFCVSSELINDQIDRLIN